jgi:hypothetical protein
MFKKNTAVTGFGIGHFINATTGAAVTTGTPVEKRTIDGTGGDCANAASYNTDGAVWEIDLAAADLNGDCIILSFTLTDCLPISYTIKTVTGVPDASGYFPADAVALHGDATAAENAEKFFDGTGYAGTNNVIPTVTTLTGHTPQTGDSYAIVNGDHGLVSIQDDIDAILADTNELQADWANGGRLDLLLDATLADTAELQGDWANGGRLDLIVDAILEDTGTTLDGIVDAILEDTAAMATTIDARLAAINLDHLMATGDATLTNIVADNTALAHLMAIAADISDYDSSTDSLEGIAGAGGGGAPTVEQIRTEMDTNSTQLAAILADTDVIGSTGQGLTSLATAAELAKVPKSDSTVTWNATALGSIQTAATASLNAYDPPTNAEMEARTLAAAAYATAANQVTIAGYLDTEIAAILAAVDTEVAAILADTNELQTNQGNWLTATGFSTHSAADVKTAIEAAGSHLTLILEDTGTTLPATLGTLATATNLATLDTLIDRLAPLLVGNVTGAGTGTEVYSYGGVTVTVTVDSSGNVSSVVFS